MDEAPVLPRRKLRRDDVIDVAVERFDERGRGVARHDGQTVLLRRGIPGDRLRVRITHRRRDVAEGVTLERLEASALGVAAPCPHFGSCGGCTLQHLDYAAQLAGKRRLVEEPLRAAGLLADGVAVEPVAGADDPWRYRNKMEFTFASRRWVDPSEPANAPADFALGQHASGMYGKVVDVTGCAIEDEAADRVLASARELARAHGLAPWDVHAHTGLLRHLVLRTARGREPGAPRELLVNLVTSTDAHELVDPYARALLARHPEITTLVHNVNTKLAATAIGERERVLHGRGFLYERLFDLVFAVSANSFFQTNTAQAERLFAIVREEARLGGTELVHDLYCGTGSIALLLARAAREVVGFEQNPGSVADARRNAALNAIGNARFVEGDVLVEVARTGAGKPDVLVLDPPRAGLHPKVVPHLAALASRRIVYVSCNPASAARDLVPLTASGYAIERVRPVDLFPHTPHVECVVSLVRTAAAGGG